MAKRSKWYPTPESLTAGPAGAFDLPIGHKNVYFV